MTKQIAVSVAAIALLIGAIAPVFAQPIKTSTTTTLTPSLAVQSTTVMKSSCSNGCLGATFTTTVSGGHRVNGSGAPVQSSQGGSSSHSSASITITWNF